jgi:hypothetical protein
MNFNYRSLPTNISSKMKVRTDSHSIDGIASREFAPSYSMASKDVVPYILRRSDTEGEKPPSFSFKKLSVSIPSSKKSSLLLAPFDKNPPLKSSLKKKPKEEISILDQKFVHIITVKRNNDEVEEDETMSVITFDDIDNNTNANDIVWRWATVHKNKINDSPPKRRRRHRRSNNMDFTTEILPNLQDTIDTIRI